jgi:propanol-preferring alcohol dehydrogenase
LPLLHQFEKHLFHEKTLTSVGTVPRAEAIECLAEAAKANITPRVHHYSLESVNEALQDLKAGRIVGSAVLEI